MKVSIIVPIYNSEKYIHRCIESIIYQTHKDIEVILIDDGSPDRCGIICDEYAKKDKRIKVIHQKNGGVSKARQAGLNAATGDYITHVDPDDWIDKNTIEEVYNHAVENMADIVVYNFCHEYNGEKTIQKQDLLNPIDNYSTLRKNIRCENVGITLCNSFIKRNIINKYNVSFTPSNIVYGEDTLFISRLLLKDIKVLYINKAYYHYNRTNPFSITKKMSHEKLVSRRDFIKVLEQAIIPNHKEDLYVLKRELIYLSFYSRNFDLLTAFPEINEQVISERPSFSMFLPSSSAISLALKGYPSTALALYHICMFINKCRNIIKRLS